MLSGNDLVGLLHQAIEEVLEDELHVDPRGFRIPRGTMDQMLIVTLDVGHPASLRDYTRRGAAHGYWHVVEAHGKGGRGHVIFNPQLDGVTVEDLVDVPA
jgi:hypothetical protein